LNTHKPKLIMTESAESGSLRDPNGNLPVPILNPHRAHNTVHAIPYTVID